MKSQRSPKHPGTILPTAETYRLNDEYAKRTEALQRRIAGCSPELTTATRVVRGGEVRFYARPDRYAIVDRGGKVRWFEVRDDGDYAV